MLPSVPTNFEAEMAQWRLWAPRLMSADPRLFERLTRHEFQSTDEHHDRQARALFKSLSFSATHVPYYRDLFRRLSLTPAEIRGPEDLVRLPMLTKRDVMEHSAALQAEWLPAGE